jgi:hypothetical protein
LAQNKKGASPGSTFFALFRIKFSLLFYFAKWQVLSIEKTKVFFAYFLFQKKVG